MQTFLPYASFAKSASVLDMKRLGKQRVECYQILRALNDPSYGWQHHPAVNMWRGHHNALVDYGLAICAEWIRRGYVDDCTRKIRAFQDDIILLPNWLGGPIHLSHQSVLIRKDPVYYRQKFGNNVPYYLSYVWPVSS